MIPEVTINTPNGLGDASWLVERLSPYADKINFNILCIDKSVIQVRAQRFLELLPKVGKIEYIVTTSEKYNEVAWKYHPISNILKYPEQPWDYAVNKPLEIGIRLEDIDKGTKVDWNLPFKVDPKRITPEHYILWYVSGSKSNYTWTENKWTDFYLILRKLYGLNLPVVLFGAEYDRDVLTRIYQLMKRQRIRVSLQINNHAADSIRWIRDADFFVGYQSGLNVIADNYNVPQVMLYFPFLKPMLNTWCKPGHAEERRFNGFTFDQNPDSIVKSCEFVCKKIVNGGFPKAA